MPPLRLLEVHQGGARQSPPEEEISIQYERSGWWEMWALLALRIFPYMVLLASGTGVVSIALEYQTIALVSVIVAFLATGARILTQRRLRRISKTTIG
ncbi:MAG: hypothetical protein AAB839_03050 [Patescibacteria group bacterium]